MGKIVSEPLLGEIRFQWWRDALDGTNDGDARANPVAAALLDTIARFGLPDSPLRELIAARAVDLYGDPVLSVEALEAYTEATCSKSSTARRADPRRSGDCREPRGRQSCRDCLWDHRADPGTALAFRAGPGFCPGRDFASAWGEPRRFCRGQRLGGGASRDRGSARCCPRTSRYFLCHAPRTAGQKPSGVLARLPLRALSAADGEARLRSLQDRHRVAAMEKAMESLARRAPLGLAAVFMPRATLEIEGEELCQRLFGRNILGPAIGGGDGAVERFMRIGELLRALIIETCERTLLELFGGVRVLRQNAVGVAGNDFGLDANEVRRNSAKCGEGHRVFSPLLRCGWRGDQRHRRRPEYSATGPRETGRSRRWWSGCSASHCRRPAMSRAAATRPRGSASGGCRRSYRRRGQRR